MKYVNHHHGCSGFVPTRPDGSEWAHLFVLDSGAVVHADTPAEVLEELVPGYARAAADENARLAARVRHAEHTAAAAQERLIQLAVAEGRLDPQAPDDAALIGLLRGPKSEPMLLASPDSPNEQAEWAGPVTVVLVCTTYAPHTATPPARGRVVWLDPTDDRAYLASLRDSGLHNYWSAEPISEAT